ncbi:hypothetical protein [Granulicoccus phenolivorans]|uniref:putative acetyltransferase n=1 Tax=Granulicoccus phenolivorans TaxID=266854 RepID=UPI0004191623|nr:hypothetical protein [Granulicoccus phenolivorans]
MITYWRNLPLAPGDRISVRVRIPEPPGASDIIGRVLTVTPAAVLLEDRRGRQTEVRSEQVIAARKVPAIARGRNPAYADPARLRELLGVEEAWAARLCDVVDPAGLLGQRPVLLDGERVARFGDSRAEVTGEWVLMHLAEAEDFAPLAAWAVRRDARNVAADTPIPDPPLTG